jgi:ATP-dependent Lon protease
MFLALFPLQLALFPGEHVPLHIFEPRYKQLIAECRDEGARFGIPAFVNGNVSVFGTEVELVRVLQTYDSGEMDIVVRGVRVFKIVEFHHEVPNKLYSGGKVEYVEDDTESDAEAERELSDRFSELMRLLGKTSTALERTTPLLSYRVGAEVGLSLEQRVHLLSVAREAERQAFVLEHVNRLIRAASEQKSGTGRVSSNGHTRTNGRARTS